MIRKHITRSIPVATIRAYSVTPVDGKPVVTELEPVIAYGNPTEDEAVKAVKEVYGKNIVITIAKIDVETKNFRMPVAEFATLAECVENSDEVEPEETDN